MIDGFDPDENIHDILRGVRLDEIVTLSQSGPAMRASSGFLSSIIVPIYRYFKYIWETWSSIFVLAVMFELPFSDLVLTIAFSFVTTAVLGFALLWCLFANLPLVTRLYSYWSNAYAHGLGLVNAADPKLFNALTDEQTKAAKRKLGVSIEDSVNTQDLRVFDLDIAKFMLQLASIVYERAPIAIHKTLQEVTKGHKSSPTQSSTLHRSAATSSARRKDALHVNADADPIHTLPSPGVENNVKESMPGKLVRDVWAHDTMVANKIEEAFKNADTGAGASAIGAFCLKKEIDYEPVSELNNSSSAFCSFFWDNKSNWIVVTFKGTGITEYADWVTDLTTSMTDAHDFLPDDFSRLIKGFKERLHPAEVSELGGTRPWDSIRYSLCKAAQKLSYMRTQEGKDPQINVWFTGHSLGCALATLAYTRIISTPSDVAGYPIVIRDCYLFAAPVSADRECAVKFNDALAQFSTTSSRNSALRAPAGHAHARTMWRVRNAGDAIATLLPQLGDRADLASKLTRTNPAGFAHLGAEIIMKDSPALSGVASPCDHFGGTPSDYDRHPSQVRVDVRSDFTRGEIQRQRAARLAQKGEALREKFFVWAENIPLIGRFIAHDTVLYWDQLDRIAVSPCKWVEST
jgi:hypothetical protein